jgi:CBS domain-containing protein
MFNFAVASALERYQPILRDQQIKAVDPVPSLAQLEGSGTQEGRKETSGVRAKLPNANSALIRGYDALGGKSPPSQRRRVWTVGDLMTSPVQTLHSEDSLSTAWSLMQRKGFRHIPILSKDGRLHGLLSDRDLLPRQADSNMELPISSVMTTKVLTCFPESSLRQAASIMLAEEFSSMPVVDRNCMLLGLLTTSDILKALVQDAPLDLWA